MYSIFTNIINEFTKPATTNALFKAFVFVIGCFLVGVKDQGPFLFKEEAEVYKLKYEVEAENNNTPLEKIICNKAKEPSQCKFAKYKYENMNSYNSLFIAIMDLIHTIVIILGGLCIASFVLRFICPSPESTAKSNS